MTYSGLFDECKKEEEQIRKLKAENKRLKEIDKEHQKLNGKLHLEIEQLKKDNTLLQEGNEAMGLYRDENVAEDMKKLIVDMTTSCKLATTLIRKNPRNIMFSSSIKALVKFIARLDEIYKKVKTTLN
jgi:hypothetical protein|tara:strand:+ start:126 stop:509 length:384 start_codon:yes stop_codon:yes gene_type:complete